MTYRAESVVAGEYYHVFNQGVEKRPIFLSDYDRRRFMRTMRHYLSLEPKGRLSLSKQEPNPALPRRVELIAYTLMGNHFHLLLRPLVDEGISRFIADLTNSYTKYFNTRHDRVGPLLRGPYKIVRVTSDAQLLHLSRYIHINAFVAGLVRNVANYPWSSYPVYVGQIADPFVSPDIVLGQVGDAKHYAEFVADRAEYARSLSLLDHRSLPY